MGSANKMFAILDPSFAKAIWIKTLKVVSKFIIKRPLIRASKELTSNCRVWEFPGSKRVQPYKVVIECIRSVL